jgi:hypothetical protein
LQLAATFRPFTLVLPHFISKGAGRLIPLVKGKPHIGKLSEITVITNYWQNH